MSGMFASGHYYYPVDGEYPRPTLNTTDPADYYFQLNRESIRGFTEMARRWRMHADARKQLSQKKPWIPFIQNHSNRYATHTPRWFDGDPIREPTAAELRQQCNIALAHGADGVMFYEFVSAPWVTDDANLEWPPDFATWAADTAGGARLLDPNMGALGFVHGDLSRRECDWNGENKWDSTATYINGFLKPIGTLIHERLRWERSKAWNLHWQSDPGSNALVSRVISFRQDSPQPIDKADSTIVQISEFTDATTGTDYLFVLNGRTHPTEGHRHITVKLSGTGGSDQQWKVTRVLDENTDGDIWIVRPSASPVTTTVANGFTDYFEPGSAALYRLEPIENSHIDFDGSCISANIIIEPAAELRTYASDHLRFSQGHGLFCDGRLVAYGTIFGTCPSAEFWSGIIGRNNGSIRLENSHVYDAPVIAGSGARDTLTEGCTIQNTTVALIGDLGSIVSEGTMSHEIYYHYWGLNSIITELMKDNADGGSKVVGNGTAIWAVNSFMPIAIDECEFRNFWRGIFLDQSELDGDIDGHVPPDSGNNSFNVSTIGLQASNGGYLFLGYAPAGDRTAFNEILVSNPSGPNGGHALADFYTEIGACNNWWGAYPPQLNTSGWVYTDNPLQQDPIPFTTNGNGSSVYGGSGSLSKSYPSPPSLIRTQVRTAFDQNNPGMVRHLIGRRLASNAIWTDHSSILKSLHQSLRKLKATAAIDSLLTLCLARPDIESKLVAADILAWDKLYVDAVEILNSYSFTGSNDLLHAALMRKIHYYPYAQRGGYENGLAAIDTLRQLTPNDTVRQRLFDLYPILFSRLTLSGNNGIPKKQSHATIARAIPEGIEIDQNYPNPFRDVTSFTFKLGKATHVRLTVHDAMGREVAVLTDADYNRGIHSVVLQSTHLPSGLYFYRFMSDDGIIQRKMMLVR